MSIRPGWFWHENEEPHSLERLYNTYLRSCGANACLNLNVPPTREGKFDERDVKRLKEFRRPHPRDDRKPHSVHGGAHRRHAHAARV